MMRHSTLFRALSLCLLPAGLLAQAAPDVQTRLAAVEAAAIHRSLVEAEAATHSPVVVAVTSPLAAVGAADITADFS